MKLLNEDILFGANQLDSIRTMYRKSSLSRVVYSEESDKELLRRLVRNLHFTSTDNSRIMYCCLYAASYGPDTNENPLLRYINDITDNIVNSYAENVQIVLSALANKEIELGKQTDAYLRCESLYNRNKNDFEYAVKAFDAVINKKDKYFDVDSNNRLTVSLSSKLMGQRWFGKSSNTTGEKGSRYSNDETVDKVVDAVVDVDQKYFFEKMAVNAADNIIPSGLNSTGNYDRRTIWGYMELWTNSAGREGTNTDSKSNYDTSEDVAKARNIIRNSNMSDQDKKALMSIVDNLS